MASRPRYVRRRKSRMSLPLSRMRPLRGVVKAGHQVRHRRLAGAAAAHQRDHRSAGHDHAEVAHHRPAFAILELDVLEANLPHHARRVAGVGPVGLVVLHRQHFEHALHRRQRTLQLGEGIDDVPHRVQQQEGVPLERHDVADGGAAAQVQVAAVPDDDDVDDCQQQVPGSPEDQLAALREQLLAQHGVPRRACSRAARELRAGRPGPRECRRMFRPPGRRSVPRPCGPNDRWAGRAWRR